MISIVNGIKLIKDSDIVVYGTKEGKYEPETFEVLEGWLSEEDLLLDIGAYSGVYSFFAESKGAKAYACEPNPFLATRMEQNKEHNNSQCPILEAAISNREGKGSLFLPSASTFSSACRLNGPTGMQLEVVLTTVDVIDVKPTIIKIDTEGHEVQVLEGATETLSKYKPKLIIEVWNKLRENEIIRFLKPYGYELFELKDELNLICE